MGSDTSFHIKFLRGHVINKKIITIYCVMKALFHCVVFICTGLSPSEDEEDAES